jgi:hypothetical protein
MNNFQAPLAEQLTPFVAFKRSLGFKYTTEVDMLRRFDRWTQTQPGPHVTVTEALVKGWLDRGVLEGERTQHSRISLVRQVGLYLNRYICILKRGARAQARGRHPWGRGRGGNPL